MVDFYCFFDLLFFSEDSLIFKLFGYIYCSFYCVVDL